MPFSSILPILVQIHFPCYLKNEKRSCHFSPAILRKPASLAILQNTQMQFLFALQHKMQFINTQSQKVLPERLIPKQSKMPGIGQKGGEKRADNLINAKRAATSKLRDRRNRWERESTSILQSSWETWNANNHSKPTKGRHSEVCQRGSGGFLHQVWK